MKVLVAMDSFKGSLSSVEANKAVAEGIVEADSSVEVLSLPLADGGEGTVGALVYATDGQFRSVRVSGPLGEPVIATYGILGDGMTAVIEVAEACGLPLVPVAARNPLVTTTYGVGELILDAIGQGCREFVVGLGGSATNDGGIGMLQALGYRFYTEDGELAGPEAQFLSLIRSLDSAHVDPRVSECRFRIACDVDNPLCGEQGASAIFGPQKGATPEMVRLLDEGLGVFAGVIEQETGMPIRHLPGAGAAGGLGAAFSSLLHGALESGISLVLDAADLEQQLTGVDLVITGEGRLDGQTVRGKTPVGVARRAKRAGIPVVALAGGVTMDASALHEHGIDAYFSIMTSPLSLEEALEPGTAYQNMRMTASQLLRFYGIFIK